VLAATNPVISNADNAIDSFISASSVSEILNDRISDLQVDADQKGSPQGRAERMLDSLATLARALPIPRAAPVMTATLPDSFMHLAPVACGRASRTSAQAGP
jgi:hypothetical protein